MVAAYHLHRAGHEIIVFEADKRIGGHTHTHTVAEEGPDGIREFSVDSGFIVYNPGAYPNFTRMLDELGVDSQTTSMSLSVTDSRRGLTWSSDRPFTRWLNVIHPRLWSMLRQLPGFHAAAMDLIERGDDSLTIEAFARTARLNENFLQMYLLPMGAAVWSSPVRDFRDFPALFLVQFMHNHRMLQVTNRPTWHTVRGGSNRYMDRLTLSFRDRIRLGEPVLRVRRTDNGVTIDTLHESGLRFDHAVLGCHCDQSLRMLEDADASESDVLKAIPYQTNHAVLHTDITHLPESRNAWSSWNVRLPDQPDDNRPVGVTYWMNRLQNLDCQEQYCVTLNPSASIR
jgi:predicted NAD/FAD-binding protein